MSRKETANKDAGCFGTTLCFAAGTIFGSFALCMGIAAENPGSGGNSGMGAILIIPALMLGVVIGGIVTTAVLIGCVIFRCRQEVMGVALVTLPSLLLFVGGICGAVHQQHSNSDRFERDMEAGAESGRIYRRYYLQVKADPEIVLRDKWYSFSDERRRVYEDSMRDKTIPYSLELLKRFYQDAPSTRPEIFENRACDAAFLTEHFEEAWDLAQHGHNRMLTSIVLNPHSPRDLVEKVAQAKDLPEMRGVAVWAKDRLDTIDHGNPSD